MSQVINDWSPQMKTLAAGIAGTLVYTAAVSAAPQLFTDRSQWVAAAGQPGFSDDFSAGPFQSLYPALGGPAVVAGGAVRMRAESTVAFTGANSIVRGPWNLQSQAFGAYASLNLSIQSGGDPRTTVTLEPTTPLRSLAFLTWSAASSRGTAVDVYSGTALVGSYELDNADASFFGLVFPSSEPATLIELRPTLTGTAIAEGLALDNLEGSAIPAPSSAAGLALAGVIGARRRRRAPR